MKKLAFVITLLSSLLSFTSCDNGSKGGDSVLLPTVTGAAFDLLIVGDPTIWRDPIGREIFDIFDEDTPGLPQSESLFTLSFIPESQFDRILKPARNIIIYQVDDKMYTSGKVTFKRNRWAKVQAIVQITAPDAKELIRIINEKKQEIIDYIVFTEYERTLSYYKRYANGEAKRKVLDSLGVKIHVPDILKWTNITRDFAWISNGSLESRQDVVIYRTPYNSKDDFKLERIIAVRDSILKERIDGPSEGSYMTTEVKNHYPVCREMNIDGKYCVEVRGLWRVEGDMMGGPFCSRSFYDEKNNDIVTIEVFVYAPQHKKRNKIRLMEAISAEVEFN